MPKVCVLDEDKVCTGCGECDRCDLDPNKICDNCMKCMQQDMDEKGYRKVNVGKILLEGEEYEKWLADGDEG